MVYWLRRLLPRNPAKRGVEGVEMDDLNERRYDAVMSGMSMKTR